MKEFLVKWGHDTAVFLAIILVTVLIVYLFNRISKRYVNGSSRILNSDPVKYVFLRRSISTVIYLVGISVAIYNIPGLRILAKSLLAGAGVMAVAIGFAAQQAFSNIISGIFIVIFKPFRIGDRVSIDLNSGHIEDITLRHTIIKDLQNKRVVIPNSIISEQVITNYDISDQRVCQWIDLSISYDSDIARAKQLIHNNILKHPLRIDGRSVQQIEEGVPEIPVRVIRLNESSVDIRGWAWAETAAKGFEMACDLYETIKEDFDKNGIEIPFPHRKLIIKEPPVKTEL